MTKSKTARSSPCIRKRMFELALAMNTLPAHYFQYYYFKDEVVAELQAKPTTRAQDILAQVPDYWAHYREQAELDDPHLDPKRSRGGIHELELAIDAMDAIFNDRKEILPVNVPNRGSLSDFPDDLVVETQGYLDRNGITPLVHGRMPKQTLGLLRMLGEYQALTAQAAWNGAKRDAVRALASNPLVFSLPKAQTFYDEMAAAHKRSICRSGCCQARVGKSHRIQTGDDQCAIGLDSVFFRVVTVNMELHNCRRLCRPESRCCRSHRGRSAAKPDASWCWRPATRRWALMPSWRRRREGAIQCRHASGHVSWMAIWASRWMTPRSLYGWLLALVFASARDRAERVVMLPDDTTDPEATCAAYDDAVEEVGGFDLSILGLGPNGHLGFNEPPSPADAPTRRVQR